MIFGIGECKAAEEQLSKLLISGIFKFESLKLNSELTESQCKEIAEQYGFTTIFLNKNSDGILFQWYTFDSPPFIYEFMLSKEIPGWSLRVLGTKEFNRINVTYFHRNETLEEKLKQKGAQLFSVKIDTGVYINDDPPGHMTDKLEAYLLGVPGYYNLLDTVNNLTK